MIIIIGGGPLGLTVGKKVSSDYLIIEKEKEVGGLCRSYQFDGCTFDWGGHAFFTKNKEVEEFLLSPMNEKFFIQKRKAFIASHKQLIPYPFQANLFSLPTEVKVDCLEGLLCSENTLTDSLSLAQWLKAKFGFGIFNHFLGPYNRKVWAYPIEEIYPEWLEKRIVQPEIREIITGALQNRDFQKFENSVIKYPIHGGFSSFFKSLTEASKDRIVYDQVKSIDIFKKIVFLKSEKKISYTQLVSTMPLDKLLQISQNIPDKVKDCIKFLKYNSLFLVNIIARKTNLNGIQRLYSSDQNIVFHKLVLNGSSSSNNCNDYGYEPLQGEVSFSKYKPINSTNLTETMISNLLKLNILANHSDVENVEIKKINYAYPITIKNTKKVREYLRTFFANHDIYIGGRFGEWMYMNSDLAVEKGLAIAKLINTQKKRFVVDTDK